jgi:hypothetical protein
MSSSRRTVPPANGPCRAMVRAGSVKLFVRNVNLFLVSTSRYRTRRNGSGYTLADPIAVSMTVLSDRTPVALSTGRE